MADFTTKQLIGTIETVLTTELNSLANNALNISSETTLSETDYIWAEVEAVFQHGTNPTAGTAHGVWFLRKPDGTNYEDGSTTVTPVRAPDVNFPVRAVTAVQRVVKVCRIPPGDFKALWKNDGTGQALASSGNTLKIRPITLKAFG